MRSDETLNNNPTASSSPFASSFPGVHLGLLTPATDGRGWLVELFRADAMETAGFIEAKPVMAYLSMTRPGVARGPHEHGEQTDFFAFTGPSDFEVTLWDNRSGSPTFGRRERVVLGASRPATLIVPPGIVHAYRNIGPVEGWVFNFPNRLYRGSGRREPVDETRYEDDRSSRFKIEVKVETRAKRRARGQAKAEPVTQNKRRGTVDRSRT